MGETIFYFDEMMPRAAAVQLRQAGYKVVMAIEIGMVEKDDLNEHLVYATERGMVLVTYDKAFAGRAVKRTDHAGLICWTGNLNDIGGIVRSLADFKDRHQSDDVKGKVYWPKRV